MTTKPQLARNINLLPGIAAFALFAVLALVFLGSAFDPTKGGFPADASITAGLGYALLDMPGQAAVATEGFLGAFEIIDVVLVAALVAAVMLARREGALPFRTDGGEK